jgi:hypothetical protein
VLNNKASKSACVDASECESADEKALDLFLNSFEFLPTKFPPGAQSKSASPAMRPAPPSFPQDK